MVWQLGGEGWDLGFQPWGSGFRLLDSFNLRELHVPRKRSGDRRHCKWCSKFKPGTPACKGFIRFRVEGFRL